MLHSKCLHEHLQELFKKVSKTYVISPDPTTYTDNKQNYGMFHRNTRVCRFCPRPASLSPTVIRPTMGERAGSLSLYFQAFCLYTPQSCFPYWDNVHSNVYRCAWQGHAGFHVGMPWSDVAMNRFLQKHKPVYPPS